MGLLSRPGLLLSSGVSSREPCWRELVALSVSQILAFKCLVTESEIRAIVRPVYGVVVDPGQSNLTFGRSSSESGICAIGGSARHPERQHHFARGLWNGADRYHPSARKVYATKMMMVFRGVRAQLQNQPCGHGRRHIQAVRPGGNCGQDDGGKFTAP